MYSCSGTTQEGKYIVFRCSKSRQKLSKIREEERQIKRASAPVYPSTNNGNEGLNFDINKLS